MEEEEEEASRWSAANNRVGQMQPQRAATTHTHTLEHTKTKSTTLNVRPLQFH